MPDITMCTTDECPLRKQCYRYSAEPDEAQAFKKYIFVTDHNRVTCDKMIPIDKIPEQNSERPVSAPFNDALVTQLAGVTMSKAKRRKSTKVEVEERVLIARDMLQQGASNLDIYRATKEQTGFSIGPTMLCAIRQGHYVGWGAHVLKAPKQQTSDVPPARVQVPVERVVKPVTLQQALRLVSAAMRDEKIAKLSIWDDGRVKASVHETKEWTVD